VPLGVTFTGPGLPSGKTLACRSPPGSLTISIRTTTTPCLGHLEIGRAPRVPPAEQPYHSQFNYKRNALFVKLT
jgi:hypothetical protein